MSARTASDVILSLPDNVSSILGSMRGSWPVTLPWPLHYGRSRLPGCFRDHFSVCAIIPPWFLMNSLSLMTSV